MFGEHGRELTLCGLLKRIANDTNDKSIRLMADEATVIAKKIDTKLKLYSDYTKHLTHKIIVREVCQNKCFFK